VIIEFIALDSVNRALAFYDELILKLQNIIHNPYIYRKRDNSQDEYTRELIFKGYTIPFEIDLKIRK
jgi:toxin ParE1/3/4